jgi:hypothetical protein
MRIIIYLTIALLATHTLAQATSTSECPAGCGACVDGKTCLACRSKVSIAKVTTLGAAYPFGNKALAEATTDMNVTDCSSSADNGDLPTNCLIGLYASTTTAAAGATASTSGYTSVADSAAIAGKYCTQCATGFGPSLSTVGTCAACPTNAVICLAHATAGSNKVYACGISVV